MMKNHPRYFDVVCDPKNGIVPRCLIYEEDERSASDRGSVIVGINPGRSAGSSPRAVREREFYKSRGCSYEVIVEYWNKEIRNYCYYVRSRAFVDSIDLHGPILWTELVKCESPKNVELSVQTIRDSINRYLFKELEVIPEDWPLIALGGEAFKILGYRFPGRTVIGIPHVTGSRGQFLKLFSQNKINPDAKKHLNIILADKNPIATTFKCRNNNCKFR